MFLNAPWHYYLMAALYILAGLNHFRVPRVYLKIMPPYLPQPYFLVGLSGFLEILAGIGLFFIVTKTSALYLIILMLLAFLLVHVYMLSSKEAAMNLPQYLLIFRFLLQFVLIWWAYQYLAY